jgi:hypothetical protein
MVGGKDPAQGEGESSGWGKFSARRNPLSGVKNVSIMHDPALARTARTLVQIAPSPRPDEREAGAATRALHLWRERVKAHGKIWHHSLPCRGLRVACRAALLAEGADVGGSDVEDTRACAARLATDPHAPRLMAGCWLRLAHHPPFIPPKRLALEDGTVKEPSPRRRYPRAGTSAAMPSEVLRDRDGAQMNGMMVAAAFWAIKLNRTPDTRFGARLNRWLDCGKCCTPRVVEETKTQPKELHRAGEV